jgi:hypothetical protein
MNSMSGIRKRVRRLARRLGLDANPLRRRTDKIATFLAAQLLLVFLVGAPLLAIAAYGWAGRVGAAEQRAERSWREVPAVLLMKSVPSPNSFASGLFGYSWVRARWVGPNGQVRSGNVAVEIGMAAGRTVRIWVDGAGRPTDARLTHRAVQARAATVAAVATLALVIVLSVLVWAGRKLLDRRRLADWELAWAIVGPKWTKRFWSRG